MADHERQLALRDLYLALRNPTFERKSQEKYGMLRTVSPQK